MVCQRSSTCQTVLNHRSFSILPFNVAVVIGPPITTLNKFRFCRHQQATKRTTPFLRIETHRPSASGPPAKTAPLAERQVSGRPPDGRCPRSLPVQLVCQHCEIAKRWPAWSKFCSATKVSRPVGIAIAETPAAQLAALATICAPSSDKMRAGALVWFKKPLQTGTSTSFSLA